MLHHIWGQGNMSTGHWGSAEVNLCFGMVWNNWPSVSVPLVDNCIQKTLLTIARNINYLSQLCLSRDPCTVRTEKKKKGKKRHQEVAVHGGDESDGTNNMEDIKDTLDTAVSKQQEWISGSQGIKNSNACSVKITLLLS